MKALRILAMILAIIMMGAMAARDANAETRTLTTMLIITIKAPDTQPVQAPQGLEGIYNVALNQTQGQRIIRVESPLDTPMGMPRHTFTEKL